MSDPSDLYGLDTSADGSALADPFDSLGLPDLSWLQLVDQHCHAVRTDDLDLANFEALCSESPHAAGLGSHLDGPVGLAIRRWCPPALDLPSFCGWEDYLARRSELGGVEVARRLISGAGQQALVVDTGYRGDELCSLTELADLAGAPTHEIVRIEVLAEELAGRVTAAEFPDAFAEALRTRTANAVGMKSVLAYRCGFAVDLVNDDVRPLRAALERWIGDGGGRLDYPLIEACIIRAAARLSGERGLPLQFHVGYGDPDVVLHKSNPSLLTPFIEWCHPLGAKLVLLHCWPFEREAGFLATVYPHVWMDIGLSMNYLGPSAPAFLARALECTPYPKVLYSSDAFGLPELYFAGAAQFRWSLARILADWIAAGSIPTVEAFAIAESISARNAAHLYGL